MAYTTINKSTAHFNTNLWLGNTSGQTISGVGFKPDLNWSKCRSNGYSHQLIDSVRGITKQLNSNDSQPEGTNANGITAFNSDGYSIGTQPEFSNNGNTFAGWSWKGGGTASSNTNGSITSSVSANPTAGFSISKYTGTGSNATVGHGLGAVPKMIIVKKLSGADSWTIYHASLGATKKINFDTGAEGTQSDRWNDTSPTSSLFTVGTNGSVNASSGTYIAYCFAEKQGYSKFSSYEGNGNADGTFIYTGFKPAWLMIKRAVGGSDRWVIIDNKRNSFNVSNTGLYADDAQVENSTTSEQGLDILSNGFKIRNSNTKTNTSGAKYIYMAFEKHH